MSLEKQYLIDGVLYTIIEEKDIHKKIQDGKFIFNLIN